MYVGMDLVLFLRQLRLCISSYCELGFILKNVKSGELTFIACSTSSIIHWIISPVLLRMVVQAKFS